VGKLGSGASRDVVLALVPTPMNEDDVPPTLGIQADGSSGAMQLSADWVGEHSRQVLLFLIYFTKSVDRAYSICLANFL
jgi:hypothetical protein